MKKLHLRLTVDVTYDTEGVSVEALKDMLEDLPRRASRDGGFTGDTPATIDDWNYRVEVIDGD